MKTLVFDYSSTIIDKISGLHVVVRFTDVASFMQNYLSCQQHNHVDAFVLDLPLSSLSQIEFNDAWCEIQSPLDSLESWRFKCNFPSSGVIETIRNEDISIFKFQGQLLWLKNSLVFRNR